MTFKTYHKLFDANPDCADPGPIHWLKYELAMRLDIYLLPLSWCYLGWERRFECCSFVRASPGASPLAAPSRRTCSQHRIWDIQYRSLGDSKRHDFLMAVAYRVDAFGGTRWPEKELIMTTWPSSICFRFIRSTLSWVQRQRAEQVKDYLGKICKYD